MEFKQKKLFGTDGVRGRANLFPMTAEIALLLGKAVAKLLKQKSEKSRVVIGKDTRLSCYMFENALVSGLCSMGAHTLITGPLPTPGVSFLTRAYRADAGIMISASHNPFYDNGIKIFDRDGFKLSDEMEKLMESLIHQNNFDDALPLDHMLGSNQRVQDADGRYIEYVKASFPRGKTLQRLKIFLDCANGAGHRVAPLVFTELDAKVFVTGQTPNGTNINDHCGSLHPQLIQKGVVENQTDVGIALDGDGDRVIMVDEKGGVIDGDTILAICAKDFYEKGMLTKQAVVATVMTNYGVLRFLEELGIKVHISDVGDRYVIQKMLQEQCNLGGEQSGHLIFLDHNTTGDGLISALQVLRIMQERKKSLSELASMVKKSAQALINLTVQKKPPLEELIRIQEVICSVEKFLKNRGRILVRYSGTEPVLRIMVECASFQEAQKLAKQIADVAKEEIG